MADISWTGNHDEDFAVIRNLVAQHETTLHGNGQPGVVDFVSGVKGQMRLIVLLVTVFGIITGAGMFVIAALEYNRQVEHNMIHPPDFFHSSTDNPVLSLERNQDAQIPNHP